MLIDATESLFGQNELTHTPFKTTDFVFPDSVYKISLSSTRSLMMVELRRINRYTKLPANSGRIVIYDLRNRQPIWDKKINYMTRRVYACDSLLVFSSGTKTEAFDMMTGRKVWRIPNAIYEVFPEKNLAIGKYYSSGAASNSNMIVGISLSTGKVIWGRGSGAIEEISDLYLQNDTTIMMVNKGLHTFNIMDGAGWDYKVVTSKSDYTSTAVSVAGLLLGAFTGVYVYSTGPSHVSDIISNVCHDHNTYFFAGRDKLASIEENGELKWEVQLPKKYVSSSNLFVNDKNLFMLNRGYARYGANRKSIGMPFLASYERMTGRQRFLIEMDKEDVILGSEIHNDTIALASDKKITLYSMEEGVKINANNSLGLEADETVIGFLSPHFGIQMNDSLWNNVVDIHPENYYVETSRKRILELSPALEVLNAFKSDDLFQQYFDTPLLRYMSKQENTIVIENSGKKVAEFPTYKRPVNVNGAIFSFRGNRVRVVEAVALIK